MRYKHIERSQALAVSDVETLQAITKKRIIDLKTLASEADSLLVSSIIRNACIDIDRSINEAVDKAINLLNMFTR